MKPVASYTEPRGRFVDIHFEGGLKLRVIVLPKSDRTIETWWAREDPNEEWQQVSVRDAAVS